MPIQELILRCFILEPEDKTAFNRFVACQRANLWQVNNRARSRHNKRRSALRNPEQIRKSRRQWRAGNPGYRRAWRLKSPGYQFVEKIRTRIYQALKGQLKSARTADLLGCSIVELRAHLEGMFKDGMTWANHGPVWHVDHKRPCASFNLVDPAQQRECFHYTNLQPLFAGDNLRKGAKYDFSK